MHPAFDLQLHHVALTVTDIDPPAGHLALGVKSFEDTVTRLKSFGAACLELPDNPTPRAQIYAVDPDGNIIEFNVDRDPLER